MASQVQRLHQFVQALQLEAIHIGGNSSGGMIAGLYAARYPQEVISVAFFAAAGVKAPSPSELERLVERGENPLIVRNEEDLDRTLKLASFTPPVLPYPLKQKILAAAQADREFKLRLFNETIPYVAALEPELPRIQVPALILWCRQDRLLDVSMVPVFERGLKQHITVLLDECGHAPMAEKPEEMAAAHLGFLFRVAGTRTPPQSP